MIGCWSCQSAYDPSAGRLSCPSCGVVLPPHAIATPFARLGVPSPRFNVDDHALERTWLDRSRKVHPDRFAKKSDTERRYAAEQTAALNDAWRALRDPYDRATWLVEHAGAADVRLPPAALAALMEAREEAEASREAMAAVVARSRTAFKEAMAEVRRLLTMLDAKAEEQAKPTPERDGPMSPYDGPSPDLARVALLLAQAKTLARLVDDLGGGRLIATLDDR
jgi:molecular chaperone HscB